MSLSGHPPDVTSVLCASREQDPHGPPQPRRGEAPPDAGHQPEPPHLSDEARSAVLDSLDDVVFLTDEVGRWTYLNRAWTRLTGYSVAESIGSSFLDYVHPDERERTVSMFMAVVAGGADHCRHRTRYRTRNGDYRSIEIRATVRRGADGSIVGNSGTIVDLTLDRQATERVAEHGALLELVARGAPCGDLPVGVLVFDGRLQVVRTSAVVDRLLGIELRVGDPIGRLGPLVRPGPGEVGGESFDGDWGLVATALRTGQPQHGDVELAAAPGVPGRSRSLRVSVIPMSDDDTDRLVLVFQDVSDLRRSSRQQAAVADLGQLALGGRDVPALLGAAADVVARVLGVSGCEVLGVSDDGEVVELRARSGPPDSTILAGVRPPRSEPPPGFRSTAAIVAAVGASRPPYGVLAVTAPSSRPFAADEQDFVRAVANVLGSAVARDRVEREVRRQALHDALTGLANRTLLHEQLGQALRDLGGSESLALLLIDLHRFRDINDTLGHDVGDEVLRVVASRLREASGPRGLVARLGGDEFAILLRSRAEGAGRGDVFAVASRIRVALAHPMDVRGLDLQVEASIGIATAPAHSREPGMLVRCAGVAMDRARHLATGVAVYEPAGDQNRQERLELLIGLRHAIEGGQLVLHYQPKVDLRSGRTTAVEALVRWQHPALGLVEPGRFVPYAEQSNLVKPLTRQVLGLALDQARQWRDGGRPMPVAVNVSARVLHDAELVSTVCDELDRTGVPAPALELELTESAVMANPRNALHVITQLRHHGVRLSVDDFGTGYSSLAYLRDLPVHDLKIDRSFVVNLARRSRDESIVRSIIELAHNLGLRVVAEGIETPEVCRRLRELGCDEGQGFFLGHPVPPADLVSA